MRADPKAVAQIVAGRLNEVLAVEEAELVSKNEDDVAKKLRLQIQMSDY